MLFASIATQDFWVATLGIAPRATNLTKPGQSPVQFAAEDTYPSLLSKLKEEDKIPSISYSYTAGAKYRMCEGNPSTTTLLDTPISSFIDATVSQIWLPLEACEAFESAFGIDFDTTSGLYLVNDTVHERLLTQNASLVFTIGATPTSPVAVHITLPYAAFDLQLSMYPNAPNATRYFPLKRAANDTQYTLGRTFLQETYLIADYERSQFSINQCRFVEGQLADIHPISSLNDTNITTGLGPDPDTKSSQDGVSAGVIVAIVITAIVVLAIIGIILTVFRRRKSRFSEQKDGDDHLEPAAFIAADVSGEHELHDQQLPKPELHGFGKDPAEMDGGIAAVEMNARAHEVHELE
ncbi:MAG: hypothetical protein Q9221_000960 [Calogaya cf. arnoldii]